MVTKLRIYFEGDARLRPGFRQFLSEIANAASGKKCQFDLIATDGTPVQDFRDAMKTHPEAWNVLVLDSDLGRTAVEGCDPESIFWMVQIMESWLLVDIDALKRFYNGGFQESALKGNPNVEQIPKADVLTRLKKATSETKSGEYHKIKHAPKLLQEFAPNCDRMFRLILAALG